MTENNWYVVTGAPSSGKTTLIKFLEMRAYKVIHEAARTYIDQEIAKGLTIDQIRKDELEFQNKVLEMKIEIERGLPAEEVIFFDRGIPDSVAYVLSIGEKPSERMKVASDSSRYKKIFLLDYYDMEKDYARIETSDQQHILHDLLEKSYKDLEMQVVNVPKLKTKESRVDFVLENL